MRKKGMGRGGGRSPPRPPAAARRARAQASHALSLSPSRHPATPLAPKPRHSPPPPSAAGRPPPESPRPLSRAAGAPRAAGGAWTAGASATPAAWGRRGPPRRRRWQRLSFFVCFPCCARPHSLHHAWSGCVSASGGGGGEGCVCRVVVRWEGARERGVRDEQARGELSRQPTPASRTRAGSRRPTTAPPHPPRHAQHSGLALAGWSGRRRRACVRPGVATGERGRGIGERESRGAPSLARSPILAAAGQVPLGGKRGPSSPPHPHSPAPGAWSRAWTAQEG
jgi:hypothetical protein